MASLPENARRERDRDFCLCHTSHHTNGRLSVKPTPTCGGSVARRSRLRERVPPLPSVRHSGWPDTAPLGAVVNQTLARGPRVQGLLQVLATDSVAAQREPCSCSLSSTKRTAAHAPLVKTCSDVPWLPLSQLWKPLGNRGGSVTNAHAEPSITPARSAQPGTAVSCVTLRHRGARIRTSRGHQHQDPQERAYPT
jgi:hypothetical protein